MPDIPGYVKGDRTAGTADLSNTDTYFQETARSYKDYTPEEWFYHPTGMPFKVSRLGFGTYRINKSNNRHRESLRQALLSGTNLIDTAHNYGEGSAELVVGDTLRELFRAGRMKREQVVLISKVGYLQGRELREFKSSQDRYQGVSEFRHDCYWSCHPEFIGDQLEISLARLGVETLDVLLIHNPECLLQISIKNGVHQETARTELNEKLEEAFAFMEILVQRGKIKYYGVSSNTLTVPSDAYIALHPDELLAMGGPNFKVLQFPANLMETDFRFNRGVSGGTLMEQTLKSGIWTLGNRPLNSYDPALGVLRLARMASPPPDEGSSIIAEMYREENELEELELRILDIFKDFHFQFRERTPALSGILVAYRDTFINGDSLQKAVPVISAKVQNTINHLRLLSGEDTARFVLDAYSRKCNRLLSLWIKYALVKNHTLLTPLEERLGELSPALLEQPLAIQVILFLLAGRVPDSVLVGMRRQEYVRQMSKIYSIPRPEESEMLHLLSAAAEVLEVLTPQISLE